MLPYGAKPLRQGMTRRIKSRNVAPASNVVERFGKLRHQIVPILEAHA